MGKGEEEHARARISFSFLIPCSSALVTNLHILLSKTKRLIPAPPFGWKIDHLVGLLSEVVPFLQ